MNLRDKVIKGLECCISEGTDCPNDCPYIGDCNRDILHRDALALIKAKQTNTVSNIKNKGVKTMSVDNNRICPVCHKIAYRSMYFHRYICSHCGWESDELPNILEPVKEKKVNIEYVYCNSPEDISWWISGNAKNGIGLNGFSYTSYPWEDLKDGSQIISVSYDQNYEMYLVVFRVEEE